MGLRKDVHVGSPLTLYLPGTPGCTAYTFESQKPRERITMIDTPGFDDSSRSGLEILATIAEYLSHADHAISGIIYLHCINMLRFTGGDVPNLRVLKALCGEHFYKQVLLVTTMWNRVAAGIHDECAKREQQICNLHWNDMRALGTEIRRFQDDEESLIQILSYLTALDPNPPSPEIMNEIRAKVPLEETKAGLIITEERKRREQEKRKELEESELEAEEIRNELQGGKERSTGAEPQTRARQTQHRGLGHRS